MPRFLKRKRFTRRPNPFGKRLRRLKTVRRSKGLVARIKSIERSVRKTNRKIETKSYGGVTGGTAIPIYVAGGATAGVTGNLINGLTPGSFNGQFVGNSWYETSLVMTYHIWQAPLVPGTQTQAMYYPYYHRVIVARYKHWNRQLTTMPSANQLVSYSGSSDKGLDIYQPYSALNRNDWIIYYDKIHSTMPYGKPELVRQFKVKTGYTVKVSGVTAGVPVTGSEIEEGPLMLFYFTNRTDIASTISWSYKLNYRDE